MKISRIIAYSIAAGIILIIIVIIVGLHLASTRPLICLYEDDRIDLFYKEQGAFGSSAILRVCDEIGIIEEEIGLRSEDVKPQFDSIVGKDIYISYKDFPSTDTILKYENIVLGDALFRQDSLKYRYHFRNMKGGKR